MVKISSVYCTLITVRWMEDFSGEVTRCLDHKASLETLLDRFDLQLHWIGDNADIPGSFWGEPEAGLIGTELYARNDTPLHSAFHEACHFICMDQKRRDALHTNAGGEVIEENAVCYLQILLSDYLEGYGRELMMRDMDRWGYSFRLGSSKRWFNEDAEDAQAWLLQHGLIDLEAKPTWINRK